MKSSRTFCFAILTFVLASCGAPPSTPLSAIPPSTTTPPAVLNTPIAVAIGQIKTWAVAVDEANIYWTDCGTNPTAQDGRVMRMSKSTGQVVALISNQSCPTTIALDAAYVYWLGGATSARTISRVPKDGGAPEILVRDNDIRALAVDDAALYWTSCDVRGSSSAVMQMPKQGSGTDAVQKISATTSCANDLAIDADNVYWIDSIGVMKIGRSGGTPIVLSMAQFHPRNLVLDESKAYWIADTYIVRIAKTGGASAVLSANEDPGVLAVDATNIYWSLNSGSIVRMEKASGAQFTIATIPAIVSSLAVDATNLYWANIGESVMRVAKSGGVAVTKSQTEPQTMAFAQEGLNGLAADDTNVYWATCRYEKEKYNRGAVMKAPKTGGDAIALATDQSCPGNLVLDANNVYWVNQGAETSPNDYQDGAVMRVAKNGGTPTVLAMKQSGRAMLAVDDANVYWTTCGKDRGILRMAKDGSGSVTQVVAEKDCPSSIALDTANIYWMSGDTIQKMDKRGGAAQAIATGGGSALVVDNSSVYWTRTEQTSQTTFHSCADERSALMETSKDGSVPVRLASIPGLAPGKIAIDESNVYYGTDCTQGILRVAKTGGASSVVIPNQVAAQIAIDASNIFWSVYTNGVILKMTRPK